QHSNESSSIIPNKLLSLSVPGLFVRQALKHPSGSYSFPSGSQRPQVTDRPRSIYPADLPTVVILSLLDPMTQPLASTPQPPAPNPTCLPRANLSSPVHGHRAYLPCGPLARNAVERYPFKQGLNRPAPEQKHIHVVLLPG
uniref:Uncharacterized protein n=1 Tax=Crocodylus porosus TaxID=8502 RepID=A0A7M4FW17_CROPO